MHYTLTESTRARALRITIDHDGSVMLTKPVRMPLAKAEAYLKSRADWVLSVQKKLEERRLRQEKLYGASVRLPRLRRGTALYRAAQKEARMRVTELVEEYAAKGGYRYTSISIRNQKTRWGSCSPKGALSFNYRLIYLTPAELTYLVVHELSHTRHHNHGAEFWKEVERFVPDYKELRGALKRYQY